jgi:Ca-activated chloride channel family protein
MTLRLVRNLIAAQAIALVSVLALGEQPLGAQAPTAKLQGQVRDSAGHPLPGAHVIVVGTAYQALADSSGYYFINSIAPGRHDVEAHATGKKGMRVTGLRLRSGYTVTQDFTLQRAPGAGEQSGTADVQGYVRDGGNLPVPNARIVIVGTAHSAVANVLGHFRIPGVAAGEYEVRASFVGYRPTSEPGVRITAGTDLQLNLTLHQTVVEIQEITAVSAESALVPRDQVSSKQLVDGVYVDAAPVDNITNVFAMQPGVSVSTRAFEDAAITTGAASREFGNGQGGVIAPTARGGRTDGNQTYVDGVPVDPNVRRCVPPTDCRGNTEAYARITDNPFRLPSVAPMSTFALDVDRASYSNVRRFITQGQRPPADAVRIEEMINYFSYDYPDPGTRGAHPFTVSTEVSEAPWAPEHQLVRVGLQSRPIATADLPASNLVFLIDVSGSMAVPNKLPLVQRAFALLVEQLRPQDRVAIVVYAGSAGLVLESTSGADQATILGALDRLQAGGSTAGGAGLRLAYKVAREHQVAGGNNRVIIATDGDFNVGASSDGEMERLIEEERQHGIFLTVLGFGMGNYKDTKLELLADKGNGNYAYIDDLMEARKMLVQEMGATLLTVAKDVKLQVEFNPSVVQAWRLIGYENRLLRDEDFNDDRKDGGELGAGHTVTALYEVIPVGVSRTASVPDVDAPRYQSVPAPAPRVRTNELMFVKVRYKEPDASESRLLTHAVANRVRRPSEDFRFAGAVAAFGMVLRDSEHRGNATVELVLRQARAGIGEDPHGHRAAFIRMVEAFDRTTQVARAD